MDSPPIVRRKSTSVPDSSTETSLIVSKASTAAILTAISRPQSTHLLSIRNSPQWTHVLRSTWCGREASLRPSSQQSMHMPSSDSSQSFPHFTQNLRRSPPRGI